MRINILTIPVRLIVSYTLYPVYTVVITGSSRNTNNTTMYTAMSRAIALYVIFFMGLLMGTWKSPSRPQEGVFQAVRHKFPLLFPGLQQLPETRCDAPAPNRRRRMSVAVFIPPDDQPEQNPLSLPPAVWPAKYDLPLNF